MIARFVRAFRAWRIRTLEQDLRYEREHADAYLAGRTIQLARLKREQDRRDSEQIRRDVERMAKRPPAAE